jgi:PGF-pre-PGF domain-containing protein
VTVTDGDGATATDSVDITVESADGDAGDTDDGDRDDGETEDGESDDEGAEDGEGDEGSSDEQDDPDSPEDGEQSDDDGDDQSTSTSPGSVGTTDTDVEAGNGAEESSASVELSRVNDSTTVVAVTDASANQTVDVALRTNASDDAVEYEHLSVRPVSGNFSLTLRRNAVSSGSDAAAEASGFDAFSTLRVDGNGGGNLSDATVEFRVSKDRLAAANAGGDDVALRLSGDGDSQAVGPERIEETDDAFVYRAETARVSSYTVGVERAALTVTDLSVASADRAAGDSVAVSARVVNDGQAAGRIDVALAMDGELRAEKSVEVVAGETTTVSFSLPVESGGEHTLNAGEASTTFTVDAQETATKSADSTSEATTTTATDDSTPGTSLGGISGFGVVAGLLAIAGAALLYRR